MLSETRELGVRTGASKDLRIAFGERPPALALERMSDYRGPAAAAAGIDDCVDEVDELLGKPNGDLLAHPITVAKRYHA